MNEIDKITDIELGRIIAEVESEQNNEADGIIAYDRAEKRIRSIERARKRPAFCRSASRIAAMLLIPVSAAFALFAIKNAEGIKWSELVVPIGERQEITLSDGSKLAVNAGSRITYPEKFRGKTREVFIDGQVVADIAQNPKKPFIIHTDKLDVRVLGTEFELKSYSRSSVSGLHLLKGSVMMEAQDGEGCLSVSPGDFVQFDKQSGTFEKTPFSIPEYKTFVNNNAIIFKKINMREACEELERIFGKRIVITDESLASKKVFAIFSNGETLEKILATLDDKTRIETTNDVVYISPNS